MCKKLSQGSLNYCRSMGYLSPLHTVSSWCGQNNIYLNNSQRRGTQNTRVISYSLKVRLVIGETTLTGLGQSRSVFCRLRHSFLYSLCVMRHHHPALLHHQALVLDRLLTFLMASSTLIIKLSFPSQSRSLHSHLSVAQVDLLDFYHWAFGSHWRW